MHVLHRETIISKWLQHKLRTAGLESQCDAMNNCNPNYSCDISHEAFSADHHEIIAVGKIHNWTQD